MSHAVFPQYYEGTCKKKSPKYTVRYFTREICSWTVTVSMLNFDFLVWAATNIRSCSVGQYSSPPLNQSAPSHPTLCPFLAPRKITKFDQSIYIDPEHGNYNAYRNVGQLSIFDTARTRKPKFYKMNKYYSSINTSDRPTYLLFLWRQYQEKNIISESN